MFIFFRFNFPSISISFLFFNIKYKWYCHNTNELSKKKHRQYWNINSEHFKHLFQSDESELQIVLYKEFWLKANQKNYMNKKKYYDSTLNFFVLKPIFKAAHLIRFSHSISIERRSHSMLINCDRNGCINDTKMFRTHARGLPQSKIYEKRQFS